jgi:AcrR family transcriptional regulator
MLVEEFSIDRPRGEAVLRAFAFLDPASVAERAGVARSAFYHHWPDLESGASNGATPFQRFVAEVFEADWGEPYVSEILGIAATHSGSFSDFVRKAVTSEWHRYDTPEAWASYCSLIALTAYGGSDADTVENSTEGMAELFDAFLVRFGRRMRDPLRTTHISAAILAVLDGFWMRRMFGDPDPNPTFTWTDSTSAETGEWNLAALSCMAVVDAMTEPVPD